MRGPFASFLRATAPTWLLAAAAVALLGYLRSERMPFDALRGDEGTYVAMAASLARDFDLEFDEGDRAWVEGHAGGPVAVILHLAGDRIAYSKPILYPLLGSPFYALGGGAGLVVFNALALGVALWLAVGFLARIGPRPRAFETVVAFLFAGGIVPYVGWRMAESLQVALATAGLALTLAWARPPAEAPPGGLVERWLASPVAPLAGGVLLGLLVALREPHAVVAAVPVAVALLLRNRRRALAIAAAILVSYLGIVGLTRILTGATNPYKANRATFTGETGYPVGAGGEEAAVRFHVDSGWATSMLSLEPDWKPLRSAYSTLYFFVGRHSGLLANLPALLVLLLVALRRPDRVTAAALAGFAALAIFFLIWWPTNYFGGETFVGNRYILAAAPCLLLGLGRLPGRGALAIAWALAAAAGISAAVSVARAGERDPTSQSHVHAGIHRLLPYESTASNIDGRRDRYWSDDFLRFVDPWAGVGPWSFELRGGDPAAEIELATLWEGTPATWLVAADAPGAALVVSDWRRTRRIPLAGDQSRSGGAVRIDLAPAWRIHPFWWSEGVPARARALRLRIEPHPAHPETRALLRYLGRREVPTSFARIVESADPIPPVLPDDAPPAKLRLRVRNMTDWTWSSEDALQVQLGVRYLPLDPPAPGRRVVPLEERVPLPSAVESGAVVDLEVPLSQPEGFRRARVVVDLVLEEVAWFADRVGEPLAEGEIDVAFRVE